MPSSSPASRRPDLLSEVETMFETLGERPPHQDAQAGGVGCARTKQTSIDLPRLLSAILDEADLLPSDEPLEQRLVLAAERLRQLGGAGARVSVILTVADSERFDELQFAGQTKVDCNHCGVRVKALFSPLWRILVLHAAKSESVKAL